QPVRLARHSARELLEALADRLIAAGLAPLGGPRKIGLRVLDAEIATLGLEEAHVCGEVPRLGPQACLDAVNQRVTQGIPAAGRIAGGGPACELVRERGMMRADQARAQRRGDVRADRGVVQAV